MNQSRKTGSKINAEGSTVSRNIKRVFADARDAVSGAFAPRVALAA